MQGVLKFHKKRIKKGQPPHLKKGQPPHLKKGQPPHLKKGQPPHLLKITDQYPIKGKFCNKVD